MYVIENYICSFIYFKMIYFVCRADDTASTRVRPVPGGVRRFDFVFKCKRPINFAGYSACPIIMIM